MLDAWSICVKIFPTDSERCTKWTSVEHRWKTTACDLAFEAPGTAYCPRQGTRKIFQARDRRLYTLLVRTKKMPLIRAAFFFTRGLSQLSYRPYQTNPIPYSWSSHTLKTWSRSPTTLVQQPTRQRCLGSFLLFSFMVSNKQAAKPELRWIVRADKPRHPQYQALATQAFILVYQLQVRLIIGNFSAEIDSKLLFWYSYPTRPVKSGRVRV